MIPSSRGFSRFSPQQSGQSKINSVGERFPINRTFANRLVPLVHSTRFECILHQFIRRLVLGQHHYTRRVSVQAMAEVHLRILPLHSCQSNDGPHKRTTRWMGHHPRGLIHHNNALILEQNRRKGRWSLGRCNSRNANMNILASFHLTRGTKWATGIITHQTLLNPTYQLGTRPVFKPSTEQAIQSQPSASFGDANNTCFGPVSTHQDHI